MIIWLGIGETSKVTLLVLAMFAPICLSAQAGVRSLPIERVSAARSLGARPWRILVSIVLPLGAAGDPDGSADRARHRHRARWWQPG